MSRKKFYKVYFNFKIIPIKCEESNFDSFISDLTNIFTDFRINSCFIIHPSSSEYNLIGQSSRKKPQNSTSASHNLSNKTS